MLKLLKKNEIEQLKAQDRQREIQEGLKLSRKVDALRELMAAEELAIGKFRDESIQAVQKELNELVLKKETLSGEVKELSDSLARMSPEMATKRTELIALQKELDEKQVKLDEKSKEIELKEIDYAILLKNASDSLARTATQEIKAKNLHKQAAEEEEEARNTLSSARKISDNTLRFKEETENSLFLIQQHLDIKEREVYSREEEVNQREKEVEFEKIRLKDMRETLQREIDRIKRNRI